MKVHLLDGTYELFRHHFGIPEAERAQTDAGATRGVLGTVLQLIEQGATHIGVATDHVGTATFELFGDDPSGKRDPGLDTQSIPVIVIGGMQGYLLHQVVRGDTVSALARHYGSTVQKIAVASRLRDPDKIQVGQILRVPL